MRNIWKLLTVLAVAGGLVSCDKEPEAPTDFSGGCEAVDLGLSVKWASYNVGATDINAIGSYFAWGETQDKGTYSWDSYKWGVYDDTIDKEPFFQAGNKKWLKGMTKYSGVHGDGLIRLLPEDDAATVNWGTKWRMPTYNEIKELIDPKKCIWKWDDERKGYTVTSMTTNNSIFLPAAGWADGKNIDDFGKIGHYYSSHLDYGKESYQLYTDVKYAYSLYFSQDHPNYGVYNRYRGFTVRAVTDY